MLCLFYCVMFQGQANWFSLYIQQFIKSKHCYLKCSHYSFPVLDTIHPNPKATEAATESAGEEEGAVSGEVEELVIGEVWESQDEMVDEGEVEGEEDQEEESDGKFFVVSQANQTTEPLKKQLQIQIVDVGASILQIRKENSSEDSGDEEAVVDILGGIDEEIPKSPRGKRIRFVVVVDIPNQNHIDLSV